MDLWRFDFVYSLLSRTLFTVPFLVYHSGFASAISYRLRVGGEYMGYTGLAN